METFAPNVSLVGFDASMFSFICLTQIDEICFEKGRIANYFILVVCECDLL